ncbi:hypothetical protein [Rhizobium sp. BK602]|uniref:hypothetical protein n=1 Tax=Rhizobium sp. BK602 TaxID=2586986 RepID=UPI001615CA80|nr:hypothetical protein [Rhizobium sp. BK602]MBB3610977.1 hypothetical protein [Rhizobium sp. BK602]
MLMPIKPPRTSDVQPSFHIDDDMARGRDGARKLPVPMMPSEIVRIETAMFFAQVSDKTIRGWAQKDGIGRQAGRHAPLQISLPALLMKVDGETGTLELLRSGDRGNSAVKLYMKRAVDLLEELRCGSGFRR